MTPDARRVASAVSAIAVALELGGLAASRVFCYRSTHFFCMWHGSHRIATVALRARGGATLSAIVPALTTLLGAVAVCVDAPRADA